MAVILTALCLSAEAQPRHRQSQPSRFYVFGEYDYYTDSSDFTGAGVGLGWNFTRYFGLQAGVQFLTSTVQIPNSSVIADSDATVFYGEAKFPVPLTDNFSIYGTAGLAYADTTARLTTVYGTPYIPSSLSASSTGYRLGIGAEYWFTDNWGLRAGWRRIEIDGTGSDIGVGIALRF